MPWRWNPKKNHYQQMDSPQSTSASAQSEALETWKTKQAVKANSFYEYLRSISSYPLGYGSEEGNIAVTAYPPLKPMEVQEGSITFPEK